MRAFITFTLVFWGIFSLNTFAQHDHHEHKKEALSAGEVHPGHSLYHLDAEFTNHRNETVQLGDFKGEPVIVVMFYGNCTQVCPILIQDTWRLYSSLDEATQQKVSVLAVSFDTENDTPAVLKEYAEYEQLNLPQWHFITGKHTDIRMLATMLGVKYQKNSDGHFAHSNLVTVLDTEGKIANRTEGLNQPTEEAASVIEKMLRNL
ncbi:SCO family protein [Gracilimonas mengyeensis]|uniref:Protein SCO1/2 n=1 Tax=Gracilimonas mengyeensis TaxID=1302730 RepID=A0A521BIK7_9BACT|nr:SCO family protein [Gracilimonas mengyeensis]SMO46932.1 protein SCO1/2 [Gracilimonas mengyeensis]